jgi:hypothetical protein
VGPRRDRGDAAGRARCGSIRARAAEDGASATTSTAFADASTFKGFSRDVELELRAGDRVWAYGARDGDRLSARADEPLVVSNLDPIAFCASRGRLIALFVALSALALVLVTGLALYPPHFGVISTIGARSPRLLSRSSRSARGARRREDAARRTVGALWQRCLASARRRADAWDRESTQSDRLSLRASLGCPEALVAESGTDCSAYRELSARSRSTSTDRRPKKVSPGKEA